MALVRVNRRVMVSIAILFGVYVALVLLVFFSQRSLIFIPSHDNPASELKPWSEGGSVIGYCREVTNASTVWLMMHGNAGQAAHRDYVLSRMSESDSLYVLQYPGYGSRPGKPTKESMNRAAAEAYQILRAKFPATPVCVVAESVGGGPACSLAGEKNPPDKIVLIVPFDSLANVAASHYWFLPVRLMLLDNWDNAEALKNYKGPVEIFAAVDDSIIPIKHAKTLAGKVPGARLIEIPGGHNDWSESSKVAIQR